jgi:hypothetical protein
MKGYATQFRQLLVLERGGGNALLPDEAIAAGVYGLPSLQSERWGVSQRTRSKANLMLGRYHDQLGRPNSSGLGVHKRSSWGISCLQMPWIPYKIFLGH